MRMEIHFEDGRRAEALVLAASRYRMRVVVEGSNNTEEWEKLDGVWCNESGERIEIEALVAIDGTDWLGFCAEVGARTMTMGASPN
jgi:hypothetical protein